MPSALVSGLTKELAKSGVMEGVVEATFALSSPPYPPTSKYSKTLIA